MDNLIEKAIIYVKDLTSKESTGHDYHHAIRVYNMALYLAVGKEVDEEIMSLAALLHDLDDYKVSEANSRKAKDFLEKNTDKKTSLEVMNIIENMSFTSQKQGKTVESLEGKIVQDADRLDALGAIGIARCFAYGGKKNRLIYDYSIDDDSSIAHFYQKLLNLDVLMNTTEAKLLAEQRIEYMKEYLKVFFKEWR